MRKNGDRSENSGLLKVQDGFLSKTNCAVRIQTAKWDSDTLHLLLGCFIFNSVLRHLELFPPKVLLEI